MSPSTLLPNRAFNIQRSNAHRFPNDLADRRYTVCSSSRQEKTVDLRRKCGVVNRQ